MYNFDSKDVAALESSGMNLNAAKKLITGVVKVHLNQTETNLKASYENKISMINHGTFHKFYQLLDLLDNLHLMRRL